MHVDAETSSQGCREQAASRGCSHQSEWGQIYLDASCRRTFVDHDVDTVILHRRVEIFLYDGRETMYFVDEKDIVRLERCEDACKVARFVEHRSARQLEADSQLVGNDVGECGLTKSWRAMQKCVVEGFSAIFRSLDKDAQVLDNFLLSAKVFEAQRSECVLEVLFFLASLLSYVEFFHIGYSAFRALSSAFCICCLSSSVLSRRPQRCRSP